MYGEYIKKARLAKNLSLREFSRQINEDPSNWSKVERGLLSPPKEHQKTLVIATVLGIQEGSDEWNKIEDYGAVDSATIPEYIMNNAEALELLPAFFRTVGSLRPSKEEIERLIGKLKED
ncbi:MAG TPA: helix-turn-helix transcriptional regulator [Treponemataceae bacterium]|nr:helix-turn-helix transcriptional regulator [Treponemataceae bacterium]